MPREPWRWDVLAILAVGIAACGGMRTRVQETEVTRDPFTAATTVASPMIQDGLTLWRLRSFPSDASGGGVDHQLYVVTAYDGARAIDYDTAFLEGGRRLDVVSIDRNVASCSATLGTCGFTEIVGIGIPSDVLEGARLAGMRVRVSARNGRGAIVLTTDAAYVSEHLRVLSSLPGERDRYAKANPLVQIALGMDEAEVVRILGRPDAIDTALTGRAFVPIVSQAGDTRRVTYHYRHRGRVLLRDAGSLWTRPLIVTEIQEDLNEAGEPAPE